MAWSKRTLNLSAPHKVKFAAIAVIAVAVALSLAVLPALTNQVFAQFPGSQGQRHTQTCEKVKTGEEKEGDCPDQSQKSPNKDQVTYAGKSNVEKDRE